MTARSAIVGAAVGFWVGVILTAGAMVTAWDEPASTEHESPITTLRTPRPPSVGAGPSFSATPVVEISPPEVSEVATTVTSALEVETPAPEIVTPVSTAAAPSGTEAPSLPPAAPTEVVRSSSMPPLRAAIEASKWPPNLWLALEQVISCESGGDPTETGLAGERGLLQIHPVHAAGLVAELGYSWESMYETAPNLDVGYSVYLAQGWSAWSGCS